MAQQKSLFSFYSQGAAAKSKFVAVSESDDVVARQDEEVNHKQELVVLSKMRSSGRQDLLQNIQQRLKCKPIPVKSASVETEEHLQSSAGNKRTRPKEEKLVCPVDFLASNENHAKRRKILAAIGADEGLELKGAWAEAKAKFEWMEASNIKDYNGRKPCHPMYDDRTLQIPNHVFQKFSASQKQYWSIKCKYMDIVLFFKVGKFYELYELDAELGHRELDWKLTVSGVGKCRQVGCPESGIDLAVQKLVSRGYKVGRMEQIETAEEARAKRGDKATVQRELVQIVTPATLMSGRIRPEAVHLLAVKEELRESGTFCGDTQSNAAVAVGFAFVDAAAGLFYVGSVSDDVSLTNLSSLLTQVAPQEILYERGGISKESLRVLRRSSAPGLMPVTLTPLQPKVEFVEASEAMRIFQANGYFKDSSDSDSHIPDEKSCPTALTAVEDRSLATSALGALVLHLGRMKCDSELLPNGLLRPYEVFKGSLRLDGQTVSNLELLENRDTGGSTGTLLSYLDTCVTRSGKRLLRRWICHPLRNVGDIHFRLDAVDDLISYPDIASTLRGGLRRLPDLERLVARIRSFAFFRLAGIAALEKKVHQRRLQAFCSALRGILAGGEILRSLKEFSAIGNRCLRSELLQSAAALPYPKGVQACLNELERRIDLSGQTGRLITRQEDSCDQDDEDEYEWEVRNLSQLIDSFNNHTFFWTKLVDMLSQIDVLVSFASTTSGANGPTCRPQFVSSKGVKKGGSVLIIKSLWHPYACGGQDGAIVPNDIELGSLDSLRDAPHSMLLTGPNMGGKSTLLRATCLAVILAQLGCYVPGAECMLSTVDTIFTRLGASDRIMAGESTFMMECNEAASVLHHATSSSLVILDELGRGTSTFDGYAIAYAVFHKLVNNLDCRLIFATHYHALTEEFDANPSVLLRHMACALQRRVWDKVGGRGKERSECDDDKEIVFLYKLTEGASPKSFGLQVALRAGIPSRVVKSAQQAASAMQESLPETFKGEVKSNDKGVKHHLSSVLHGLSNQPESQGRSKDGYFEQVLKTWRTSNTDFDAL